MSLRLRLSLVLLIIVGAGFTVSVRSLLYDIRPQYLASMEEVLIDIAEILAAQVSAYSNRDNINTDSINDAMKNGLARQLDARIYRKEKDHVNLDVYICDVNGMVIYSSSDLYLPGSDFSRWNDVYLCLKGKYGARATRSIPDDPESMTMYVAAPIFHGNEIIGSLTVAKPSDSVDLFVNSGRRQIIIVAILSVLVISMLIISVTVWVTRPIHALEDFALQTTAGKRPSVPTFDAPELQAMSQALEDMRRALDGKTYIEQYVQQLTHELKSPLSVISGASELLSEQMDEQQRQRFITNIQNETQRMRDLVDRILLLASLENKVTLDAVTDIPLADLLEQTVSALQIITDEKQLSITWPKNIGIIVKGDRLLLEMALRNVLLNAIDFSPPQATIKITVDSDDEQVLIRCRDQGPGIPAYALSRVCERFYSLQRPDGKRKGSGLGLSLVQEIMKLHHGWLDVANGAKGAVITLKLPLKRPGRLHPDFTKSLKTS